MQAQQTMASEDIVVCQMCANGVTKGNAVQVIWTWVPTLDKVEYVYVCSRKCHRAYVDVWYSQVRPEYVSGNDWIRFPP